MNHLEQANMAHGGIKGYLGIPKHLNYVTERIEGGSMQLRAQISGNESATGERLLRHNFEYEQASDANQAAQTLPNF